MQSSHQNDLQVLRASDSRSRALIQPGEEDFGIASVEALASGKPLIACGRGEAVEIAKGEPAGFFFDRPNVPALLSAIARFERVEQGLRPELFVSLARPYSAAVFENKMARLVAESEYAVA